MCDIEPEEFAELLRYVEAARVRAVSRAERARSLVEPTALAAAAIPAAA